jgi:hypothetical protein
MDANDIPRYRIWSAAGTAGSPVELPALVQAIKAHQVQAKTWIYLTHEGAWRTAGEIPELAMFFKPSAPSPESSPAPGINTSVLRRMRVFAGMDESQLALFVRYMEVVNIRQARMVYQKGDHADAMYLVLEGELRAKVIIDGRESILSTIAVGESFGEIAVLDHGPRSADVVANVDSVLLKITATALERLMQDAPAAVAPFLAVLAKSVASRVRHLTKRYEDSIHFARAGHAAA